MDVKYSLDTKKDKINGTILSKATKSIFDANRFRGKEADYSKLIIPPDLFERQETRPE